MGKVTSVSTSVSRLIKDGNVPNSVLSGSIRSIFGKTDFADQVLEELIGSIGVRAERMYSHAEKSYPLGLPSGQYKDSTELRQAVEAVIEVAEGQQVAVEYTHYGSFNALHIGWTELIKTYGYDLITNEIGSLKITGVNSSALIPAYLADMVVVAPIDGFSTYEESTFHQWGVGPTSGSTPTRLGGIATHYHSPVQTSATATAPYILVSYIWEDPWYQEPIRSGSFNIPLTGYSETDDYIHTKYTVNGVTKYQMYKVGSGTYPTLDKFYNFSATTVGTYFPFIYFRFNRKDVKTAMGDDALKSMKKLTKYLGMDYDDVAEGINANPQIKDVDHAILTFAVPPVSTNQLECRYLFDYFDSQYYATSDTNYLKLDEIAASLSHDGSTQYTQVIQDSKFKIILSHSGISKRLVVGSLGKVDTYATGEELRTSTVTTADILDPAIIRTEPYDYLIYSYKKQITPDLYEQIDVVDLHMQYFVENRWYSNTYNNKQIILVPIDKSITSKYFISQREQLYSRSIHFVFNASVETKVAWYQTEMFQFVLLIVAIVLTVYSAGADGGQGIGAALGLSGSAAVAANIIFSIAIGSLMPVIYKFVVKVFGKEVATIIAIVAIIYGAYSMIDAGSITGAPWAAELLQAGNGLYSAVMQADMADLLKDSNNFNLFVQKQLETLEKAEKLLEGDFKLDPMIVFGEKPDDYYNRTVHSGNIGTIGISAISSYVAGALRLPQINDTIGVENNATQN